MTREEAAEIVLAGEKYVPCDRCGGDSNVLQFNCRRCAGAGDLRSAEYTEACRILKLWDELSGLL